MKRHLIGIKVLLFAILLMLWLILFSIKTHAQTRSSGFIAIPAQEYFRLKDSVNKLNRVNDSLRKELKKCVTVEEVSAINWNPVDSSVAIGVDTLRWERPVKKKAKKHPLIIPVPGKGEVRDESAYWNGELYSTPTVTETMYWKNEGKPEETMFHKILVMLLQIVFTFFGIMILLFIGTFKFKKDEAV